MFAKLAEEPSSELKIMEQLMEEDLSGSQLDLVMHGEGDPIAPGHCKPNQYDKDLSKAFIESEKNGKNPKNTEVISHGEPSTETSTL